LEYLRSLNRFSSVFLNRLAQFRFTGDVYAMPEGSIAFANEPLLEIFAPIPEAQLVETFVMNQIHVATTAASKAARVVAAAQGRSVVDYGLRRTHGGDAGIKVARAFYIAGVDATSNVLAGEMFSIPVSGTMAHSYVQAHDTESDAFEKFLNTTPDATLLVDTYDTIEGVRHVIELARKMGSAFGGANIRLDSGDLGSLATEARRLLNEAGLSQVKIFASSGLDEHEIARLIVSNVPIDGFGVGTHMGVSADAPYLDSVYKLVEYAGRPRLKRSTGKVLLPGRKQVFRQMDNGIASGDVLGCRGEQAPGTPLLEPVMVGGKRLGSAKSLSEIRSYRDRQIRSLPPRLLRLTAESYPVAISPQLQELARTAMR
jgi:nicotinate phosphoribosyltransferase